MTTDPIHTVADLMNAAANALADRDIHALEQMARIPDAWLQTEDEADAQRAMLIAMIEATNALIAVDA